MKEPRAIILDTGPLVALADKSDSKHDVCRQVLERLSGITSVFTVPSVLAEVFSLLPADRRTIDAVFGLLSLIGCQMASLEIDDLSRAQELMKQYYDLPMDFADCEIMIVAERLSVYTIFSLDKRDFSIYRPKHGKSFRLIPD